MFSFKDIIGQATVKERLTHEVCEGRIPHAQLFCGPAGAGKLALALAYARYLCCPNRNEKDACGTCPSCVKWDKLIHPDVHFAFPIVKNAKTKKEVCDDYIAEWRRLLLGTPYFNLNHWLDEMGNENGQAIIYARESDEITRKLSLKSSQGGYKIVIVWLPEKMHELSRTQRINIPKIEETDMAEALSQKYGVQPKDSATIAHLANGNFVTALETIHLNEENELFFNWFVSLMRLSYQRKIREMKQWSEQLASIGRERQKNFLAYCQRMIRENFVYNLHCKQMNYMTLQEQEFAVRFAPFVNERNVMGIMNELSEAQIHIEQNVNARMVFFDFALKMIVLLKQ